MPIDLPLAPSPGRFAPPRLSASELAPLLAEASSHDTSPERLEALLEIDDRLAVAVAGNPGTPQRALERLAAGGRPTVRAAIAANPNATFQTLVRCIASNPAGFLANPSLPFLTLDKPDLFQELPFPAFAALVTHPDTPSALLDPLIERSIRQHEHRRAGMLLTRPNLTHAQAMRLHKQCIDGEDAADVPHVAFGSSRRSNRMPNLIEHWRRPGSLGVQLAGRSVLARGRPLPLAVLQAVLPVADPQVRRAIASNRQTPPSILEQLEADPNPHVTMAVQANPATPEAVRLRLYGSAQDLRCLFAGQPTSTLLADLARHPSFEVKVAVARHPDAPTLACERFASSRSVVLRRLAAAHPNTPEGSLLKLVAERRWGPVDLAALRNDVNQDDLHTVVHWPHSLSLVALQSLLQLQERRAFNGGTPPADADGYRELIMLDGVPGDLLRETVRSAPVDAVTDYARFEHAHPTLLESIANLHTDLNVLEAVAANPNTPAQVQSDLAKHQAELVRVGAASNPRLPEPCVRALLRDTACSHRAALHPCFTLEERRKLCPLRADLIHEMVTHPQHHRLLPAVLHPPRMAAWMDQDRSLTASALDLLRRLCSGNPEMERRIAAHPNVSPELLRTLSRSRVPQVLDAVAGNRSTSPELLEDLLQRRRLPPSALRNVGANPSLPEDRWAAYEDRMVASWLADYHGCPFWPLMLTHPACPVRRLVSNARSPAWRNRLLVAMNPSTPREALQVLADDGLHPVRQTANRTLQALSSQPGRGLAA